MCKERTCKALPHPQLNGLCLDCWWEREPVEGEGADYVKIDGDIFLLPSGEMLLDISAFDFAEQFMPDALINKAHAEFNPHAGGDYEPKPPFGWGQ
jgi:hypothetical protein